MTEETLIAGEQPDTAPAQLEPTAAPVVAEAPTATEGASTEAPPAAESAVEYEPFALPEGIAADEGLLAEFKATAKELKLPQKDAQKFADLGAKIVTKQQEAYQAMRQQWHDAAATDTEFGGEKLQENLGIAKKALDAFGSDGLRKMLNDSGLGNHPEVIRHFIRVGKAISEDGRIVSGSKAQGQADPAKRMFPNQA